MDRKLLLLINQQWTHPLLDRFMAVLSSFDLWAPILLLGALWLLWRGGFLVRAAVLTAALAAGVADGVICSPLKQLVDRARPHQALSGLRCLDLGKASPRLLAIAKPLKITLSRARPPERGRSFPSSHTANTAAAAVVLALFSAWRAWPVCAVPLLVGYSRIYTGAHWPSDVLGSLLIGALTGGLCAWGVAVLWARLAPRWWPGLAARHPHLLPA